MPVKKKKKVVKKKTAKKKTNGLQSYQRFIKSKPGVKAADKRIKKLTVDLNAAKRKKIAAVKVAKRLYKSKRK